MFHAVHKEVHGFITMALLKMQKLKCMILLFTEVLRITLSQQVSRSLEGHLCAGECCAGFFKSKGKCIECPVGKYGIGCMENCPANWYGRLCQGRCDCEEGFYCSSVNGCEPLPEDGVRCSAGRHGPKCTCPQNRYGVNCSLTCTCETNQQCHVEHGCQNMTTTPSMLSTEEQTTGGTIDNWIKENITGIVCGLAGLAIGAAVVSVLLYAKRRCVCHLGLNRHRVRETQPVRFFLQESYTIDPENVAEAVSENVAVSDRDGIYPLGMHNPQREIRVYGQYERKNEMECQDQGFMDNASGGSYTEIIYEEPIQGDYESYRLASSRGKLGYSHDI